MFLFSIPILHSKYNNIISTNHAYFECFNIVLIVMNHMPIILYYLYYV